MAATNTATAHRGAPDSVALLLFFVFWYAGNLKYNEYNAAALRAIGGKDSGLTLAVATAQLGVCAAYAVLVWAVGYNPARLFGLQAPAPQSVPRTTTADLARTVPLACCAAGAHAATVFALGGDPLFGQIVKAAEPVLAALVGAACYNKAPSTYKVLCLPVIVGGVAFASLKKGDDGAYALKFDTTALVFGMLANAFAAFKGGENGRLLADQGVAARYGGVGNQFAVTQIVGFVLLLPLLYLTEGDRLGAFAALVQTDAGLRFNLAASGLCFYLYNELATYTLKVTGAVTASVANTAKRVIVMVYMAAVTGKALTDEQKMGSAIAIVGVLLYSLIDDLMKPKAKAAKAD